MPYTTEEHQQVASRMPRDSEGHFIHENPPQSPPSPQSSPTNPLSQFLSDHTHYSPKQDDLVDVHIGNPLRKITLLLEEIKRQKAFSFTLKGSLGIAGVALTLSLFGLFGGAKLLCSKGIQSQTGTVKMLSFEETKSETPLLSTLLSYLRNERNLNTLKARAILLTPTGSTVHLLPSASVSLVPFLNTPVIVTGSLDSCANTLLLQNPTSIEPLQ